MAVAERIDVTPILSRALRSFGKARAAMVAGHVDEMIDHLTRGAALLEELDREAGTASRRRPKKSAS